MVINHSLFMIHSEWRP